MYERTNINSLPSCPTKDNLIPIFDDRRIAYIFINARIINSFVEEIESKTDNQKSHIQFLFNFFVFEILD